MPIHRERNILFLHIPKCAGSTVTKLLEMDGMANFFARDMDAFAYFEKTFGIGHSPQHYTLLEYESVLDAAWLSRARIISFVRNPWDRMVSEFLWKKRSFIMQDMNFADFISKLPELKTDLTAGHYFGFDNHLLEQWRFFVGHNGFTLPQFIGRYENFANDMKNLCDMFGFSYNAKVHLKASKRESYHMYYGDAERKMVAKEYEKDIDLFKYVF